MAIHITPEFDKSNFSFGRLSNSNQLKLQGSLRIANHLFADLGVQYSTLGIYMTCRKISLENFPGFAWGYYEWWSRKGIIGIPAGLTFRHAQDKYRLSVGLLAGRVIDNSYTTHYEYEFQGPPLIWMFGKQVQVKRKQNIFSLTAGISFTPIPKAERLLVEASSMFSLKPVSGPEYDFNVQDDTQLESWQTSLSFRTMFLAIGLSYLIINH